MTTYAILLRAVNVGGNNLVAMPRLRAALTADGFTNVQTYVQSGNVIVESRANSSKLEHRVAKIIHDEFGIDVAMVVRTAAQLRATVTGNPFAGRDEKQLYVMFLASAPSPAAIARIDTRRSPGDEVLVRGHDLYLHLTNGAARTKFSVAYLEKCLGTSGTMRNWNTTNRVTLLAGG